MSSIKCRNCADGAPKLHGYHRIVRGWFAHCGGRPGRVNCLLCGETFFECAACLSNLRKINAANLICSIETCFMVLSSEQEQERHCEYTHSNYRYACIRCGRKYKSKHAVKRHSDQVHMGLRERHKKTIDFSRASRVRLVLQPGESLKCFLCTQTFTSARRWLFHMNKDHLLANADEVCATHRKHYSAGTSYISEIVRSTDTSSEFKVAFQNFFERIFGLTSGLEPRVSARDHTVGPRLALMHRKLVDSLLTVMTKRRPPEERRENCSTYFEAQTTRLMKYFEKELVTVWTVNKTSHGKSRQTIRVRRTQRQVVIADAGTANAIVALEPEPAQPDLAAGLIDGSSGSDRQAIENAIVAPATSSTSKSPVPCPTTAGPAGNVDAGYPSNVDDNSDAAELFVLSQQFNEEEEDLLCSSSAQPRGLFYNSEPQQGRQNAGESPSVQVPDTSELEITSIYPQPSAHLPATSDAGSARDDVDLAVDKSQSESEQTNVKDDVAPGVDDIVGNMQSWRLQEDGGGENHSNLRTCFQLGERVVEPSDTGDAQAHPGMLEASGLESEFAAAISEPNNGAHAHALDSESNQPHLKPQTTRTDSLQADRGPLCYNCLDRGHKLLGCPRPSGGVTVPICIWSWSRTVDMTVDRNVEYSVLDWTTWREVNATDSYRADLSQPTERQHSKLAPLGFLVCGYLEVTVVFEGRQIEGLRLVIVTSNGPRRRIVGKNWIIRFSLGI